MAKGIERIGKGVEGTRGRRGRKGVVVARLRKESKMEGEKDIFIFAFAYFYFHSKKYL